MVGISMRLGRLESVERSPSDAEQKWLGGVVCL